MAMNANRPAGGARRGQRGAKKPATQQFVVTDEGGVSSPIGRTTGFLTAGRIRSRDITVFLRQLIMLLESGTPLLKSLKTLAQRSQRAATRGLVADIAEYVEAGNPLWQAFERHPRYFGSIFVNLIKASEASGTLVTVLGRLVSYRERREMLVKRVRGALLYPIILVAACFAVVLVIAKVVVPQFELLFEQFGVKLPAYTVAFIGTSKFIASWWWLFVLIIAALIILYKVWYVRSPLRKLTADHLKLKLPIMGPILQKNAIVEFTRTMALLLRSGLSMMVTLDLVRHAINNQAVVHTVQALRDAVEQGQSLEQPLRDAEHVIPAVVTDMLVTGEESGQLDNIAEQIANTYEEEVQISINTLGEALQPILTVFLGCIVILLALALFFPLVGMIEGLAGGGGGV